MVKGITRQVILVKSPDPRLFEETPVNPDLPKLILDQHHLRIRQRFF